MTGKPKPRKSYDPKETGKRLRAARDGKHLTQAELAQQARKAVGTISRWERGYLPKPVELIRIADLLGIPREELVEPEQERQEAQERLALLPGIVDALFRIEALLRAREDALVRIEALLHAREGDSRAG